MITATFFDNGHFAIEGHARFDELGKDIVCAGVSSMAYLTTLGLLRESNIDILEEEGFLDVYVIEPNTITRCFIASFFYALKDLSIQYPKNIQIKGVKLL